MKPDPNPIEDPDEFEPDELRRIAEGISAEFPPPRLGTELVLLDVDPRRAHAYWNIDPEDFADARLDAGQPDAPLVLRMYDVTGVMFDGSNAHEVFDHEIQGLQGHWYLDLFKHGRTYVAEIGFRRSDGSLAFLARSNEVRTPPAEQSAFYDTSALDLDSSAEGGALTDLVADLSSAATTGSAEETASDDTSILSGDYPRVDETGEAPLKVLETAPVSRPAVAVPAPEEIGPWPEPEEVLREKPGFRDRVEEFYRATTVEPSAITESEDQTRAELESAPPAPPPVSPGDPPAAAPLEQYVHYSSFEPARTPIELEVNTEIHVFGRARPGSRLVLFGQEVPLRPDGTFSVRKPLPQGAVIVPIQFSPNGHE